MPIEARMIATEIAVLLRDPVASIVDNRIRLEILVWLNEVAAS